MHVSGKGGPRVATVSWQSDVYSMGFRGVMVRQLGERPWERGGTTWMETLGRAAQSCEKAVRRGVGEKVAITSGRDEQIIERWEYQGGTVSSMRGW